MKWLALIPLGLAAITAGSVAAEAVFVGLNTVMHPSHDLVLVTAAYLAWGLAALGVFGLGWRQIRRWRG